MVEVMLGEEGTQPEYVVDYEDYDELRQAAKDLLKLAIDHMCQDDEDESAVVERVRALLGPCA